MHITALWGESTPGFDVILTDLLNNEMYIVLVFTKPILHPIKPSILSRIFPNLSRMKKDFLCRNNVYNGFTDKSNFLPFSILCVFSRTLENISNKHFVNLSQLAT